MKWKIVLLVLVTMLGLLVFCFWFFILNDHPTSILSSSQKEKALVKLLGRSPHLSGTQIPTTWTLRKNQYIQFSYPSWAKIYTSDNQKAIKNGDALDSFAFALLDERVSVAVSVVQFSGTLAEYPGVNIRVLQNDIYTPSASISAGTTEITFSKVGDKVEKSAFFLKNGKIVSIAVTGYSDESVTAIFTPLVGSLKIF